MSNGSEGRKISQFVQQTSVPSGSFFSFIYNGTNYKIGDSDFYAALGVTGTLEQKGDPLGTPILNTAGTVNEIRNLESGPGVKTSVSPQGGATIEHNFTADNTGVPVLVDETEDSPIVRSLQAGNGIALVGSDGEIVITATAAPVSNKTIVVNEVGDLPDAVGGVRTLLDNREYLLTNDIDIGSDRLVLGANTALKGTESTLITLTSLTSGDLITMTSSTNRVANLSLNAPNSRILNWSSTTSDIFRMNDVTIVACDKIAVLDATGGNGIVRFTNVSPASVATDGVEFIGNFRSFYWNVSAFAIDAGAMFNLGTATFDSFIADTALATLNGSSNLVSGQSGSANINTGGSGLVTIMRIEGAGTPLSGVTVDDALWEFRSNDDIADTRPDGLLSMQGNTTNTVIASAGTPVLIAGTWTEERTSQMTGTAAGRLTYDGGKNATLPFTASVSIEPVSGGTISVSAQIAIDGVVVANSKRTSSASSGNPTSITVPWQDVLSNAQYVEVFITNEDSTVDLLVASAIFRIN